MLLRTASLALVAGFALAPAAMAETAPTVAAAEHVSAPVVRTTPAPSREDASRYASRESQDKQAAEYEGGSLIVVGISGGAIIVLLLLLLILA
jgi:hypothetical protein